MRTRTALVALAAGLALPSAATAGPSDRSARVEPSQRLAVLLGPHTARMQPSVDAPVAARVAARRPLTGARTVLPVLAERRVAGQRWLRVRLPGRPNSASGWVRRHATAPTRTVRHIVVDTSSRRLTLHRAGRRTASFRVIVGAPSTPTPTGSFFVEELVALRAWDAGAPYALALSARSEVLQEFAGGPGQIAVHGLAHVRGTLGTGVSHGCVRLGDRALRRVVAQTGPGVPVTIRR